MKRLLVCLLLTLPLVAGETVTLDTRAANLAPGTKVRVEIGAEYRMYQLPKRPAGHTEGVLRVPITEDMIFYRATSANRGQWQFTMPQNGGVPTPRMELRFAKDFPETYEGMRSKLYFTMKYTLDVPARNGQAARSVTREIETTMGVPKQGEPLMACLRFEQIGDGMFVGVTPGCTTPLNRRPSAAPAAGGK